MAEPTQTVAEVMTNAPATVAQHATLTEVAELMRERAIGVLVVVDDEAVAGLVSDRDIVVRCIADGKDPTATEVREACSEDLVTVTVDTPAAEAAQLMRDHAVRRLPVINTKGRAEGIVSLGDLAVTRDPDSALSDISTAPPNA